jgi:phosphate transport system protein
MAKCCSKEIEQIKKDLKNVLKILINNNRSVKELINDCNSTNIKKTKKQLNRHSISELSETLDKNILTALSCEETRKKDIRMLVSYLKTTNEIIKIAQNTRAVIGKLENNCDILLDKNIKKLSVKLYSNIIKVLEKSYEIIGLEENEDIEETYNEIIVLENKIDTVYDSINRYIITQNDSSSDIEKLLIALRKSEKTASRAVSIASIIRYPYSDKE